MRLNFHLVLWIVSAGGCLVAVASWFHLVGRNTGWIGLIVGLSAWTVYRGHTLYLRHRRNSD